MNDLNSSLIEGKIHVGSKFFNENKFTLVSSRYLEKNKKIKTELFFIDIYVDEKIKNLCEDGCGVRAVGRLKNENEKVVLEAEHIEFRPVFKEGDKNYSPESALTDPFIKG